jgi:hypothetical protein
MIAQFNPRNRICALFIIIFLQPLFSQNMPPYFYHHYPYGSEAAYNPIFVLLNGAYSIMQVGNRDKKVFEVHYRTGWTNVWRNISDPVHQIRIFGWKKFLTSEVFPSSLKPKSGQYVPNYQDHLIGGGMTYRALDEWYEAHGFSRTRLWSIGTCFAYHFLNEVVEINDYQGVNVDPIADLLIFDPLGILLFSSDRVARFFGETLRLRDWSTFPAYCPSGRTMENNSDNYSMKWTIPGQKSLSLFYHFGLNGLLGLSYTRPDGSCWSAGAGVMSKELKKVRSDGEGRIMTVDLIWNAGIFYDRNGSLLASLLVSGSRAYKAKVNVFPGLVRFAGVSPALFAAVGQKNEVIFGFAFSMVPLGLAFQY